MESEEKENLPVVIHDVMTSDQIGQIETIDSMAFGVDSFIALFNAIPIVGGVIANEMSNMKSVLQQYKVDDYFRKFLTLIYNIKDTSKKERETFMADVEKNAEDYSGSITASMVDRIDNVNKAVVLANLMKAKMNGQIDIEDFFRLSNVVERIPYTDFKYLKEFEHDTYLKGGITGLLFSTGILQQTYLSGDVDDENLYCLSDLGIKLCLYGLHQDVNVHESHGTAVQTVTQDDIHNILIKEHGVSYDPYDGPDDDK